MNVTEVLADGTTVTRNIVAPKGIYKTPHGYRVQLNVDPLSSAEGDDSHNSRRGKFSRNSKTFEHVSIFKVVMGSVMLCYSVYFYCFIGCVGI